MLLDNLAKRYTFNKSDEFGLLEYFNLCREDRTFYESANERMVRAFGKPEIIDTAADERLGRIFSNRKIKLFRETFGDVLGIENVIEAIYNFYLKSSQGTEEQNQILALHGPVGSAKSTIATNLRRLMEKNPIYTIKARNLAREAIEQNGEIWEISPFTDSPLWIFDHIIDARQLEEEYKIPARYAKYPMSPWLVKRLREGNTLHDLKVVKLYPSILQQIGIAKFEPKDANNQDVSVLIGQVDMHKMGFFGQDDVDAYAATGALNLTSQGLLEGAEFFKNSIDVLHPFLEATQAGEYKGNKNFGGIPWAGTGVAHYNLKDWQSFKNEEANKPLLDRMSPIDVPYCLRLTEEAEIYKKYIRNSELRNAPTAPGTLEMMAKVAVLSRIVKPEGSSILLKAEVYDGQNIKAKNPSVKSLEEYKDNAGYGEGMSGFSTRLIFKILSSVYNYDSDEIAANPIHLMTVLEDAIKKERYEPNREKELLGYIKELGNKFLEDLQKVLQSAYIKDHAEYCQNVYERYIQLADHWLQDKDYKDPDTGLLSNRDMLNKELEKIEKAAKIVNAKDFRTEMVNFDLRSTKQNKVSPRWDASIKMKEVIESKVFAGTDDLLPVISFSKKTSNELQTKHNEFVERMVAMGYTTKQIKILVEWYSKNKNNG